MASHMDPGRDVVFDGDSAVMVTLGHCIDPKINDACVRLGNRVRAANLAGVRDVVEGYTTVTVHFDLRNVSREFVHQEVVRLLGELGGETVEPQTNSIREVTLPVCYDNEFALDLADVAAFGRCTQEEVIRIHANLTYRVYMLGFQPGFAYLGRSTRRLRVQDGRHPALTCRRDPSESQGGRRGYTRVIHRVVGKSLDAVRARWLIGTRKPRLYCDQAIE